MYVWRIIQLLPVYNFSVCTCVRACTCFFCLCVYVVCLCVLLCVCLCVGYVCICVCACLISQFWQILQGGGGGIPFPLLPQIEIPLTEQKPVCVVSSSSVVPTCLSTSFVSQKVFKVTWCGAVVTPRNKCGLVPFLEARLPSFC